MLDIVCPFDFPALNADWDRYCEHLLAAEARNRELIQAVSGHIETPLSLCTDRYRDSESLDLIIENAKRVRTAIQNQLIDSIRAHTGSAPDQVVRQIDDAIDKAFALARDSDRWPDREHDRYQARILATARGYDFAPLWSAGLSVVDDGTVRQAARQETAAALGDFKELPNRHRWPSTQHPVAFVRGNAILTASLYGSSYDEWTISYSRRERLYKLAGTLRQCLHLAGEAAAARALDIGTSDLMRSFQQCERYTTGQAETLSEDLSIKLFKDTVKFYLSPRLFTAVRELLADTAAVAEAA